MPPQRDNHNEDEDKYKEDKEVGPEEDDAAEELAGLQAGRAAAAQAVTRISSTSASMTS
jgi:hypothetical protein